jgi:hypothetical protein
MMVLKKSNHSVLSTGHINQLLFVCCFGTRIAQEKLNDPSMHAKTAILTLPFQRNWQWPKLVILVPVLCGVTPCMEHCYQANTGLLSHSWWERSLLAKSYVFISHHKISMWFNATWIEFERWWPTNKVTYYLQKALDQKHNSNNSTSIKQKPKTEDGFDSQQ